MKNRILSFVIFIVISCFTTNNNKKLLNHFFSFNYDSTFSKKKVVSILSEKILTNTSQSESSENNYNNLLTPNLKKSFKSFWTIAKIIEQLLKTKFSQYTNYLVTFLIQHRKKDIIFPSHYFW
ncbi:hypothetical protein [Tenacibaculum aestuariivivum]|uniref:hypothetical protein n=1 Tax=Tenacibaculum aestuariivivum TaxID=2006131 RepID=UPI003AB6F9E5